MGSARRPAITSTTTVIWEVGVPVPSTSTRKSRPIPPTCSLAASIGPLLCKPVLPGYADGGDLLFVHFVAESCFGLEANSQPDFETRHEYGGSDDFHRQSNRLVFRRTGFDPFLFDYEGRSIKVIFDAADGTC